MSLHPFKDATYVQTCSIAIAYKDNILIPSILIIWPNSPISEAEPQQLESYIEVCALLAGFPLHTAFFVPPYSSQTTVDTSTHVSAVSTSKELSWQQMLQRHWESLQPNKLTGDATKKNHFNCYVFSSQSNL